MFCPNCGTQNPETALTCAKCNFNLKGAAAPKFKGTMLMMNQPGQSAPPGSPGAAPQAPRPVGAPPAAPGAAPSKLKGTMVGVAPPVPGAAPAAPGGFGAPTPPPAPSPFGAPPEQQVYQPPGQMAGQMGANPLAGTVAADNPGNFGNAFGAPQQQHQAPPPADPFGAQQGGFPQAQQPYGAPPQQQPYGAPPQQYGAPPQQYGAPPQQYGAPPQQQPYGAPQQGYGAPPAYGQPPAQPGFDQQMNQFGQQMQQGMQQFGQQAGAALGIAQPMPGQPMMGAAPTAGAGGVTRRNALMTFLMPFILIFGGAIVGNVLAFVLAMITPSLGLIGVLVMLAGVFGGSIIGLLSVIKMVNELKGITGNSAFAWWPIFIPFYNYYWLWIMVPAEVARAKQMRGIQQPPRGIVVYIFLFLYALASDLNDMA